MKLEVAEACSGIRSLMSLFTLAVFYGYFLEKKTSRRMFLAFASIPIAVAANAFRIVGLACAFSSGTRTRPLASSMSSLAGSCSVSRFSFSI